MDCTCTNGQGPPPAATRPGRGAPNGVCPGGPDAGAVHRDGWFYSVPRRARPSANRGSFWALPVRSGEGARESDSLHGGSADSKERWALRTARLGRQLHGEWGVGGAFRFADQDAREDRAGTQDRTALRGEARFGGNDLRAPSCGHGEDGAELKTACRFPNAGTGEYFSAPSIKLGSDTSHLNQFKTSLI